MTSDKVFVPRPERSDGLPICVAAGLNLPSAVIASLDDAVDEDAEVAWQATIESRIAEIDSSAVKMVPWSVARKRILGD